jgi:predicted nucleic acid-binding protein
MSTPPAGLLIDTSALAIADRPPVTGSLSALLRAGAACTCPLLDVEALSVARSPQEYRELAAARQLVYRAVPLSAAVGERMCELQLILSRHAHFGLAEPGDLQVAATAIEHGMRVVHYSAVFELLGQLCHLDQEAVAPLGSLT